MQKKAKFIDPGMLPVNIGFCGSKRAWKHLTKFSEDSSEFTDCGACDAFLGDEFSVIISMNSKKLKEADQSTLYSVLAHEVSHAADSIFDYIKESAPSPEFKAYLTGWLVREGAKAFKL